MATVARIAPIKAKIERAKEHVRNLDSETRSFIEGSGYTVVINDEPKTGDRVFTVKVSSEPSLRWGIIVGDVMHNLRSSLDHLAWQLVIANKGKPGKWTGFPIMESLEEFEAKGLGKIKGASTEAMRLVESLEPYKGGNNALYALHRLNITDKHRLLITIGATQDSIAFGARTAFDEPIRVHFASYARTYPLKDGTVIYRIDSALRNEPDMDMDPHFHFEVAMGEPGIFYGEALIPSLLQLGNLVDSVVNTFFRNLPELTG